MKRIWRSISGSLAIVLALTSLGMTGSGRHAFAEAEPTSYEEIYISDLDWTAVKHGKVKTQKDQIAAASLTGQKMKMEGVTYDKGLGSHADSKITYQINGDYNRLTSVIGIDDEALNNSKLPTSVVFAVYGDGDKLYESPQFTAKPYIRPLKINVDVSGVHELSLEVTGYAAGSNPQTTSYADWADAKLINGDPEDQTAESVASSIRSIAPPEKGQTLLRLPYVPDGFTVAIAASDREDIIPTDAQIFPVSTDVTVTLVLAVTKLADGTTAETAPLQVLVPGVQPAESANKTALESELANAQAYYDNAVEGTEPGQYPPGSKEELGQAIAKAKAVYTDDAASQYTVNQAAAELHESVLSFLAKAIVGEGKRLESVSLTSDHASLNLDGLARLRLSGQLSDGSDADLKHAYVKYSLSNPNVLASVQPTESGAEVRAGTKLNSAGTATVTATVTLGGITRTAEVPITVQFAADQPFQHAYHQTLTMKMFMAENNGTVRMTFEQALATVKKIDSLTRGIPKIIYLVGWQFDGHDTGYPALDVVNPKLKREQDERAEDSLKWLMDEAFKYNTTISLHINMLDASSESPLWDTYLAKDVIARENDGSLRKYVWGYPISYTREWEEGLTIQRIDKLLELLPIQRAGTIHIDAFHQNIPKLEAGFISPYHKITSQQEAETQKKIIRYFRDKGVDVTAEFDKNYRVDPLIGLQPMAWHIRWSASEQFKIPASIYTGGDGGDERLGTGMLGESIIKADRETLRGFIDDFALKTLPSYYLNRLDRVSDQNGIITFSEGVTSRKQSDGSLLIEQEGETLRDGGDVFFPALWNEDDYQEIIAYSKNGYENRTWKLPIQWKGTASIDVYSIGIEGLNLIEQELPVQDGSVRLTLLPGQAVSFFPAGTDISAQPGPFSIIEPADGALEVDASKVALRWEPSAGADTYRVMISENFSLQPVIWNHTTEDTAAAVSALSPGKTYYWKVIAMKKSNGKEQDNTGGVLSFKTRNTAIPPEQGGGSGAGGSGNTGITDPGSTNPQRNGPLQPTPANYQIVEAKDLVPPDNGKVKMRENAEAIVLTSAALKQLGTETLTIQWDRTELDIPGQVFDQWIESAFDGGAAPAKVILKLTSLSREQFFETIDARSVPVHLARNLLQLGVSVEADGVVKDLTDWKEAVKLHFALQAGARKSAYIYTIQDGKLTRLSDFRYSENGISADIFRSGSYGAFVAAASFTDVPENYWAYEAIAYLESRGILQGVQEGRFEPGRSITRAEFTALLVRAMELPEGKAAGFKDIDPEAWYGGYVQAAVQEGLVLGVSDSEFAPDRYIARQEMVVMLMRAYYLQHQKLPVTGTTVSYIDEQAVAQWAFDAVKAASELGLVHGRAQGRFAPAMQTTRAEAAAMIYRMMNLDYNR
ncbi:NPCBM/NEW2 domain-containing protein [Paenibacillus motobuensis]|uniref:S-layer homology domain-containing protein n=1 Tax=Paenibacillus TaxID=44249 RepID=UPI00203A5DB3|nr:MULTISPECIES: S-layer homology domain-containing protein [Paenibacillus]MCM3038969.1 NPCBM/NEW2 domain-containing protein [Paenibacillus lutimineralis]MCM3646073.1 NPCBM/NEW2 domain-containing protein [Paenibacillus motobuensis]